MILLYKYELFPDVLVEGYTLYLPVVNRDQMGTYQCIADNGIPPQANQTFHLEVQCESSFLP